AVVFTRRARALCPWRPPEHGCALLSISISRRAFRREERGKEDYSYLSGVPGLPLSPIPSLPARQVLGMGSRRGRHHPGIGEGSQVPDPAARGGSGRGGRYHGVPYAQQGRGGYQGQGGGRPSRGDEPPHRPGEYPGREQARAATRPQHFPRGGRGGRGAASSSTESSSPLAPELRHELAQASPMQAGPSESPPEAPPAESREQHKQVPMQAEASAIQEIVPAIPSSSKSIRFPLRPGKGSIGTRCLVKANHFFAELPDKDLHQYDVSITPEVTSRIVCRDVIKELVNLYKESYLGGRLPAYDGRKSLYTAGALPFTSQEFHITLLDDDDGSGSERRRKNFKVVIKFAARADLHRLELFLAGRHAEAPQEALQVLDIVLRELPSARYAPFGRSFFSPRLGRRQPLGDGLESWRGFYQSIRPTQMGLSLNIDISATAFIEPLPVIEFVAQLLNSDIHSRPISDAERVKIKKALRGVKVEVTHRGNMRRKYRIFGLTTQATRELTFPVDEGGMMKSVVQYFQETYGFAIQHTYLPCLQVGNQQRPNYLPMEVCKIVEGQRYSKRLNQNQIRALLEETCQHPRDRERDIIKACVFIWFSSFHNCLHIMVKHNAYEKDDYAKEFGIKISDRMTSVEARILPAPRDFAREPVLPPLNARPDQVERALKVRYHDAMNILGPQRKELDLLIGILPDNNGSLYGDLKRVCEIDLGIVSQCCCTKQVFKMNKQILANLALKINVKVGGRNNVLSDAVSRRIPLVTDRPTIIFGADVTHPHPGEDSSPSIAAGTSRPAHYHVLWDENNFTADSLQTLTNNLCYTYARCTRSVSIVPPAYYAHLAAFRARFYMEPEISDSGSVASGPTGRGPQSASRSTRAPGGAVVKPLPALKDNVKRVMFYC
ncbi:hypothetical protein EJB05_19066, partial [Eragrostis curvula]